MTTPMYPFGPAADPAAAKTDPRGEALTRLLGRADLYGDRGDSTETITRILNRPDMARADRAQGMWADRTAGLKATGDKYTSDYAAALAAAKSRSGGGRAPTTNYTGNYIDWLEQWLAANPLVAPTAPTTKRVPLGGGGMIARMK